MAAASQDAYCTLLMSDSYLPGAAVLAHSLRDAGTQKKLAVLYTPETLSADTVEKLKSLYDFLIPVEHIRNPKPANLYLMQRPDLVFAFTKIALWRQVQFRKIVYLDADMVALRALDELFDIDTDFAAAPDIGWPDAFNSGLMVLTPNMGEYWALQTMAASGDSFDGADQGLLNQYYQHKNWHRLSFTYNCTPNAQYQWEPAYRYYKPNISAVHFIGKDKPWSSVRTSSDAGVYNELVARWWAVYDKHLRGGEQSNSIFGTPSSAAPSRSEGQHMQPSQLYTPSPNTIKDSGSPPATAEAPFTEPGEPSENIDHGVVEPVSTVQQRRFSAPQMEWDATRSAPPPQSRPEAANFTTQTYEFNESRELFNAPRSYPEPPKDMWYKVPETKPTPSAMPKPIFPWEQIPDRPKPTRVFAEDTSPLPTPDAEPQLYKDGPLPSHPFPTVHYEEEKSISSTVAQPATSARGTSTASSIADAFQQNSVNAWDEVPGIENYVRAILGSHTRRGKPQVIYSNSGDAEETLAAAGSRSDRRESLIITDFPSAVERPSLPVTPAPRPAFLNKEKTEAIQLPEAEGVPAQPFWNPNEKLEQLRRTSLLEFEHLKSPNHPVPPLRALPQHSVPSPKESGKEQAPAAVDGTSETTDSTKTTTASAKPVFTEPNFDNGATTRKTEEIFSPTQEDVD
ncbi:glycosyltransferase family 8 protein [Sporormia fimetaria CBS 119925]|uniref:glycogenin glucosyltransferase n=1 Tax=Sporormia fimetaria CBS 119925 TaxID=1340428 RepID=A0A6A6UYE3_9PLEO|nr:glycosyltransferase family 8 protein [Sporormia fimetaria CBS 119925]